jgi:hypothetical protein
MGEVKPPGRSLSRLAVNDRTWHETDMPATLRDVRFQGQSGKHVLVLSFSGFDPKRTCRLRI